MPPDRTATTGGSNAVRSASTAATAAAPAGSTTSLARSSSSTNARDPVVADRDNVVDEFTDQRERDLARAGHGDPVGHGRHGVDGHRPAGRQRSQAAAPTGLDPDDAGVRLAVLDCERDPGEQATSTGAHHHGAHVGTLVQDLQSDGPCPATMSGWSNGWISTAPVSAANSPAATNDSSTDAPAKRTSAPYARWPSP